MKLLENSFLKMLSLKDIFKSKKEKEKKIKYIRVWNYKRNKAQRRQKQKVPQEAYGEVSNVIILVITHWTSLWREEFQLAPGFFAK